MGKRQDEHKADEKDFPEKHPGGCLTGHEAKRAKGKRGRLIASPCNYRYQGAQRAEGADFDLYKEEKYQALVAARQPIKMLLRHGEVEREAPKPKAWDPGVGDNFMTTCNVPYWHEAHHIVPHGELRDSIDATGEGDLAPAYRTLIRGGLLDEQYKLNDPLNMIILPMDVGIARVLRLPRHRQTPTEFSHRAYSRYVRGKLNGVFKAIRKAEKDHELPAYQACKEQIEVISETTRKQIVRAGGLRSLDEAFAEKKKRKGRTT